VGLMDFRKKYTDYILLDQKICSINSSLETNILAYINPQNVDVEKKRFFDAIEKGEQYNPKFSYVPRNPVYTYFTIAPAFDTFRRELKEMIKTCGNDSLSLLFEKRMLDLFEKMDLMRSAGTENFTNNSEEYYGRITPSLLSLAREIVSKKVSDENRTISAKTAVRQISDEIKSRGLPHKIVPRKTPGFLFSVDIEKKVLYFNESLKFSETMLKRVIAHEIEAHVYRFENGALQPYKFFSQGVSKENIETEEGLAVKIEELKGISDSAQLKKYAGRVIAVHTASRKSFYDTFQELKTYFSDDDAFTLTLRAKRGTFRQEGKGAFTKDILYLRGKLAVDEFLEDYKIEDLYKGRYSVYDYPLVRDVDGLKPPKYLPSFLKK
jgi:uncharacterized protein (TIGR02421 family)